MEENLGEELQNNPNIFITIQILLMDDSALRNTNIYSFTLIVFESVNEDAFR